MAERSDLADLTKEELYERAQKADIDGRSRMDKGELVDALESRADSSGSSSARAGDSDRSGGGGADDRPSTSRRSMWKGAITFGLITIPVGLYSATESTGISFHLLDAEDGSRIRYRRINESTGEEVDWEDTVKGFEYESGKYVTFTREELDRIPSESHRTIDVVQFVDVDEIDPVYFDTTYYIAPDEVGVKAYALLAKALDVSDRVGIAKVTLREKEHLAALRPYDGMLVLDTMRWPNEIRVADFDVLEDPPAPSDQELAMAGQLIDQLTDRFDPALFRDTYRDRLDEAIQAKIAGEDIVVAEEEPPSDKVVDLLEALRSSVEQTKPKRGSGRRSA